MAQEGTKHADVLRLTRHQYREFFEQTKAAGLALNISTYKHMGCWGTYSPWALSICKDATVAEPQWDEHAVINIASAINANRLRAVGPKRPELDWQVLDDEEIYPFLVQHEIGHRQDNFDQFEIMIIKDLEVRDKCHRRVRFANEVLADRYAWNRIRPGEPIPLSKYGEEVRDRLAEGLAYLEAHAPKLRACRPEWQLTPGSYRDVPDYMLASLDRAAFLGPAVNRKLVSERSAYYRMRNETHGRPLF
ncbi:MAG: hypothetical protein V4645_18950 [Pseudomonadota bacterium]